MYMYVCMHVMSCTVVELLESVVVSCGCTLNMVEFGTARWRTSRQIFFVKRKSTVLLVSFDETVQPTCG